MRLLDRSELFSKKKVWLASGLRLEPWSTSTSGGGFGITVVVSFHLSLGCAAFLPLSPKRVPGGGVSCCRSYGALPIGGYFSLPHDPWLFLLDTLHRYTKKPMSKRKTKPTMVPPAIPIFRAVDDPPLDADTVAGDGDTDADADVGTDPEDVVTDTEGRSRSLLYHGNQD